MNVKIKLGEHEVLAAGSVIGNPQTPIQIEIENLSITFRFENNDDEATKRVNITNQSPTSVEITCNNFDNPTGTGNRVPILIGSLNGRDLYFSYRVYALNGEVGKLLHYTFYV